MAAIQRAVVIAGGGPTGLMLAAELKLADPELPQTLTQWFGHAA